MLPGVLYTEPAVPEFVHSQHIAHIPQFIQRRKLSADMPGLGVDSLTAAEDHILPRKSLQRGGERFRGSDGIGAGEYPVTYQHGLVRAHSQRAAQHRLREHRGHTQHGDISPVSVLELQGCFKSVCVRGVYFDRAAR